MRGGGEGLARGRESFQILGLTCAIFVDLTGPLQ